ncbi:hypothetical protein AB4851_13575 [Burkholderia sp. 22PA0099]|uniref:hypothetical protein n=1 Tax=Burkholderia sp. 22PA0099 TaxID=3237372 RepID=UPI0039C298D8
MKTQAVVRINLFNKISDMIFIFEKISVAESRLGEDEFRALASHAADAKISAILFLEKRARLHCRQPERIGLT